MFINIPMYGVGMEILCNSSDEEFINIPMYGEGMKYFVTIFPKSLLTYLCMA